MIEVRESDVTSPQKRNFDGHKKSRFQANSEILAVFYSEKYGDFVRLIKYFGVIGRVLCIGTRQQVVCNMIIH